MGRLHEAELEEKRCHKPQSGQEFEWPLPKLNIPAVAGDDPDAAPVRRPEYADAEEGLTIWRMELQEVVKQRSYYRNEAKPKCMKDIITYMSNEVRNQLVRVPEYAARLAANDIIWMRHRAEFIATGFGGASINMDALAVMRTQLGGGVPSKHTSSLLETSQMPRRD